MQGRRDGALRLVWAETGVPAVAMLIGKGTTLIERFAFGLDAGVRREFKPTNMRRGSDLPLTRVPLVFS